MDDADSEIVVKHFNARHVPIAGLSTVRENMSDGVIETMRAYHARIHHTGTEDERPVNHTHRVK